MTLGNEKYEGVGKNAYEALTNLSVPPKIFPKGFLVAKKGDKKKELTLLPIVVKKFFYPNMRRQFAKQLEFGI